MYSGVNAFWRLAFGASCFVLVLVLVLESQAEYWSIGARRIGVMRDVGIAPRDRRVGDAEGAAGTLDD